MCLQLVPLADVKVLVGVVEGKMFCFFDTSNVVCKGIFSTILPCEIKTPILPQPPVKN
jgi:hypothetical protein